MPLALHDAIPAHQMRVRQKQHWINFTNMTHINICVCVKIVVIIIISVSNTIAMLSQV